RGRRDSWRDRRGGARSARSDRRRHRRRVGPERSPAASGGRRPRRARGRVQDGRRPGLDAGRTAHRRDDAGRHLRAPEYAGRRQGGKGGGMNILTIARRELAAYFYSPIAYVVLALFLVLQGVVFVLFLHFLNSPMAPPGAVMQFFFGGTLL